MVARVTMAAFEEDIASDDELLLNEKAQFLQATNGSEIPVAVQNPCVPHNLRPLAKAQSSGKVKRGIPSDAGSSRPGRSANEKAAAVEQPSPSCPSGQPQAKAKAKTKAKAKGRRPNGHDVHESHADKNVMGRCRLCFLWFLKTFLKPRSTTCFECASWHDCLHTTAVRQDAKAWFENVKRDEKELHKAFEKFIKLSQPKDGSKRKACDICQEFDIFRAAHETQSLVAKQFMWHEQWLDHARK